MADAHEQTLALLSARAELVIRRLGELARERSNAQS